MEKQSLSPNTLNKDMLSKAWCLYILQCCDGTYYTGVTNNLKRRVHEHNQSNRASKYTRTRRPVTLIFSWPCKDRSHAQSLEHRFKKLTRKRKEEIINDKGKQKDFFQTEGRQS